MIWIRLFIAIIVVMALIYYAMLILHCYSIIRFTGRRITFRRMIIPFYYWLAPFNEKKPNK